MGIKAGVVKLLAPFIAARVYKQHRRGVQLQHKLLHKLVKQATHTRFGQQHNFGEIKNYADYRGAVKVRDYEEFKEYIEAIAHGRQDVLWPGKPLYFCKSSGTTSGTKYIPVTKEQLKAMMDAARNSLLLYVAETGKAELFDHKMIFLQGSPELEKHGVIPTGRLSGIVYHHTPFYVNANRMPSYEVNCLHDWEEKVAAIAAETLPQPMALISGIPPWVVMYFEKLLELSGKKTIQEIFPRFKLFAHGGVNYEPYRDKIESLIGFKIDTIETYPASEGFIAYQDKQPFPARQSGGDYAQGDMPLGLLLNLDGGIFYEFIRTDEYGKENARRIMLEEVEVGVNYALVLSTNAGLWAYSLGDTVKFVSKSPYRILVTGRVKHFISAFGEHVIAEEVELALLNAMRTTKAGVSEFTVAPQINAENGEAPYHEWFVEFSKAPTSINEFAEIIDQVLQQHNVYYKDLRTGHILQRPKIRPLPPGSFVAYMKTLGKLGGQNKVPRLTNDRRIADELGKFT